MRWLLRDITHPSKLDTELFLSESDISKKFVVSSRKASSDPAISFTFWSPMLFAIDVDFVSVDDSVWFGGSLGNGLSGGPFNSAIKIKKFFFVH